MQIQVNAALEYAVDRPTSFNFNIAATQTDHQQIVRETLRITPEGTPADEAGYGAGENRLLRVDASAGRFSLNYDAVVELTPQIHSSAKLVQKAHGRLPDDTLKFLNPSRYCPSDRLARWASREFAGTEDGANLVAAICDWIHDRMDYLPGTTDAHTDAAEALIGCAGVCRDYAHIGIAFCRALGIPARYVSGYAVDLYPPDFHGFFEVFLGDAWYMYDATKMAPRPSFVRIGVGRDAADCAFATIVGSAELEKMSVSAKRLSSTDTELKDRAISTA